MTTVSLTQVLCTLLDGEPPKDPTACISPNKDLQDLETPTAAATSVVASKGSFSQPKRPSLVASSSSASSEEIITEKSGECAEELKDDGGRPEKIGFSILLGMLTITTMIDAEGAVAANRAVSSAGSGKVQHDMKIPGELFEVSV